MNRQSLFHFLHRRYTWKFPSCLPLPSPRYNSRTGLRDMTILHRFITFLLFLACISVFGLAAVWWYSPWIAEILIRRQLEASGWQLSEFSMLRPAGAEITIPRMRMSSRTATAGIERLTLHAGKFTAGNWSIRVGQARLGLANDASTPSLSWREVIRIVDETFLLAPPAGAIDSLEICLQECLEGNLDWETGPDPFRIRFRSSFRDTRGTILWRQTGMELELVSHRSGITRLLADFGFGEDGRLDVTGRARYVAEDDGLPYSGTLPLEYDARIHALGIDYSLAVPLESGTGLPELQHNLEGRLQARLDANWQAEAFRTVLSSTDHLAMAIRFRPGAFSVDLSDPVAVTTRMPDGNHVTLSIPPHASCQWSGELQCRSPDLLVRGTVDDLALDARMQDLRWTTKAGAWQLDATADTRIRIPERIPERVSERVSERIPEQVSERISGRPGRTIFDASVEVRADETQVNLKSRNAAILGLTRIDLDIRQHLQGGGNLRLEASRPASEYTGLARYLGIDRPEKVTGEIAFTVASEWTGTNPASPRNIEASIRGDHLGLDIDTYALQGGVLELHLEGWPEITTPTPAIMKWQSLDIGIPVENIDLTFNLNLDTTAGRYLLEGDRLTADFLGGTLNSDTFRYRFDEARGTMLAEFRALDLQQILALQGRKIEASGKLNGSVPVQFEQGTFSTGEGRITAVEPGGYIRYRPGKDEAGFLAQNEQLKIVVDTMEDFQYHQLEATVVYRPDGNLVAQTSLRGRNPGYENGREIHFNLRLEENLSALLRSLRIGEDLSGKISSKTGVRRE